MHGIGSKIRDKKKVKNYRDLAARTRDFRQSIGNRSVVDRDNANSAAGGTPVTLIDLAPSRCNASAKIADARSEEIKKTGETR